MKLHVFTVRYASKNFSQFSCRHSHSYNHYIIVNNFPKNYILRAAYTNSIKSNEKWSISGKLLLVADARFFSEVKLSICVCPAETPIIIKKKEKKSGVDQTHAPMVFPIGTDARKLHVTSPVARRSFNFHFHPFFIMIGRFS